MADVYGTREAAEAACSTWGLPLCCFIVLHWWLHGLMIAHVSMCLSKATSGLHWLMATSASGVGGRAATLDQGGDHWVALR